MQARMAEAEATADQMVAEHLALATKEALTITPIMYTASVYIYWPWHHRQRGEYAGSICQVCG